MPGTIVITGASGFIGSRVADHAARSLPGRALRLMAHRSPLHLPPSPAARVETVPGDLADPGSLRGICDGAEILIHCASHIGGAEDMCRTVNAHGTEALLAEARRSGVPRVVYLSTAAVHGRGPFHAARPEELPLAPQSATSRSRAAAEEAVLDAGGIVLRPDVVYGAGDQWVAPGLVQLMGLLKATVDGWRARMSLIDADDLARALLAAALAPAERLSARLYYANHPEPETVSSVLRALADACGLPWPQTDIGYEEARRRLDGLSRPLYVLDIVAVDRWFDSVPLWRDLDLAPGPGFAARFPAHAPWYKQALSAA